MLHLVAEEPIRGRLMDLEGRPARDVDIEVVEYFDTKAEQSTRGSRRFKARMRNSKISP